MHKHKRNIAIIISAILAIVVLSALWLIFSKASAVKAKILSKLPIPITLVNLKPLYYKNFQTRLNLAQKLSPNTAAQDLASLKKQVLDTMVQEEVVNQISQKNNLNVSNNEIARAYADLEQNAKAQGTNDLSALFANYGLSQNDFKQQILAPSLLSVKLAVWYNGQKDLNSEAYSKANTIMDKVNNGGVFEDLAKTYSESEQSKNLGGDLGFIEINKTLPEFKELLDSSKPGETKVVASRYGLHILRIAEKDNGGENGASRVHIKEIYLTTTDFGTWLNTQIKNAKVKNLLNVNSI